MAKAIVVRTNGTVNEINITPDNAGDMIHDIVGGYFDAVTNHQMNITAYVHDTGLLIKLDPNACASAIFGQLLVGDTVICGATDLEGDHLDLNEMFFQPDFANYAQSMNNKPEMNAELARLRDKIAEEPFTVTIH